MITDTGKNLSVLIVTEPGMDWQTFATWYSFLKSLPDAKTCVFCYRNGETPFVFYQWTKRLNVPTLRQKLEPENPEQVNWLYAVKNSAGLLGENILVVRPYVTALEPLSEADLAAVNAGNHVINEDAWFLSKPNVENMLNEYFLEDKRLEPSSYRLCHEANETEQLVALASYKKGCGRWIHTAKGCPFSCAAGLVSETMTVNEHRVVELWKKMVPLYNAVV